MPELPEVETVKNGLKILLVNKKILSVDFDWLKSFPNPDNDVNKFLIGSKIIDVRRRAKVLMIDLDTEYSLVIHLKMTGQLVYRGKENFGAGHPNDSLIGELPDKSTRVILRLNIENRANGSETDTRKQREESKSYAWYDERASQEADKVDDQKRWTSFGLAPKALRHGPSLYFNDQRKFGWMRLLPTIQISELDFFKKVGPEPLDSKYTANILFKDMQRRKNSNVKAVLLDQTIVAGVGNIYADESLWGAKIHPSTLVKDINKKRIDVLFKELQFVLNLAIEKGGSTDKNYVNAEGKRGSYMDFARVFRREKLPCPRCGTTIEKIRVATRGTHICKTCQVIM